MTYPRKPFVLRRTVGDFGRRLSRRPCFRAPLGTGKRLAQSHGDSFELRPASRHLFDFGETQHSTT